MSALHGSIHRIPGADAPAALVPVHHAPGGDTLLDVGASLLPHGQCLLWDPGLITLHVASDVLIALAYFSIPFVLMRFARARPDLGFGPILRMFALFIVACGLTHAFGTWTLWYPSYLAEGLVKAFTAVVSVTTAVALWPLLPRALAMPSPARLAETNERLRAEIAERERAESELHAAQAALEARMRDESEARFRTVVESSPSAIVLVDSNGRIELVNGETERVFGYDRSELVGEAIERLVPGTAAGTHEAHRRAYLAAPTRRPMGAGRDLNGLRRDGTEVPVEIALTPIAAGGETRILASVVDITARKRAERLLHERSAALERSNRELDDFAYVVSHDLREPLRGIRSFSRFLLEDHAEGLAEEAREMLDTLVRLAGRMDDLITSLLHYSRVGRAELEPRDTDLQSVFVDALDSLSVTIEEANAQVRVSRPLPTVVCDPVLVTELFQNLVANAIKYNDRDRRLVEIGWHEADGVPELWVRDDGIGIAPKHLDAIFQIFRRLHARDRYGGGAGAGLTIVKRIVERHGGRIRVESTPGEGTTFYFTLAPPKP